MRTAWLVLLAISSGCTVTTQTTRRMALSTLPAVPTTLGGSRGMLLELSALAGQPTSTGSGGAVAFPTVQPDVGATIQLGDHTFVGGRFAFAAAGFGVNPALEGPEVPANAGAFDLAVGAGHEFQVSSLFGFSVAGELGVSGVSLTSVGSTSQTHLEPLPIGRLAVAPYAAPGDFKLYAGAGVTTTTRNDPSSVRTEDCRAVLPCTVTDTGAVSVGAAAMVGGGARWQPSPLFAIALEGWAPLTEQGPHLPFIFALSLHLGDFVLKKRPPIAAPPPPPWVEPEVPVPPPQL